jgi:hypothetical protein
MRSAEAVAHPDSIIELLSIQCDNKKWQFQTDTILEGGQWWWKLRQAGGKPTEDTGSEKGVSIKSSER